MRYTENDLRTLFQHRFNRDKWIEFLKNFLEGARLRSVPEEFHTPSDNEKGFFLGEYNTSDHYRIGLFQFDVNAASIARRRVGLRNLVKSLINPNWGEFDAALAVFISKTDWRLSFICDIKEEQTAPKRYTYVFGDDSMLYRTPVKRLFEIQGDVSFESLMNAFSVEKVSKEFFDEYREIYADFVQYITGNRYVKRSQGGGYELVSIPWEPQNRAFYEALGQNDKRARDFVKKMMGRITFLYFLQQKGWLCGDKNYMQHLFDLSSDKDYYLKNVLVPLFFGVLNTKQEEREMVFARYKWNDALREEWDSIPYLNGGLFEPDDEDRVVDICQTHIFRKEDFDKLFDFFSRYNFTIDENDPSDAEIGVDPEMLGKIFESLLEDNKDKGAFYTPKEVVQYMCQESLILYLATRTGIEENRLRAFVLSPDDSIINFSDDDKYKILDGILSVKICDPAIGSGAFPIGLLNELVRCKEAIYGDKKGRADIKREIIRDNIYGVDIEKGAVDIARLRFWLSLIVDEEEPLPLPNLDYKIMQGNSLMEWYDGVDLSHLVDSNESNVLLSNGYVGDLRAALAKQLKSYFDETSHSQKEVLKNNISSTIAEILEIAAINIPDSIDIAENNQFFLWHTWFNEVFEDGGFDIIIGNPPYNGISQNNGEAIKSLIDDYKKEPGTNSPLKERKLWLQDDYVKFIRKMESFIESSPKGILAFINNSSFIDNPTFRGMRWHLLNNFDTISVLDLHGNSRKNNVANQVAKDENVFNIMQGVSINVFEKSRKKDTDQLAQISYAEIVGTRKHKQNVLSEHSIELSFKETFPVAPFYFFNPQKRDGIEEYEKGFEIQKLFPVCVTGVVTARDGLVIDMDRESLLQKIELFVDPYLSDDDVRDYFFGRKKATKYLPGDSRGWSLSAARRAIRMHNFRDVIIPLAFRVLDNRYIYYSSDMVDWGREEIYVKHIIDKENFCLVVPRQTTKEWKHVFVTDKVANFNFLATGGQNGAGTHFPLFLYKENGEKQPNLNEAIWTKVSSLIGYETPAEELFDYVYGILHSRKYRLSYMEFLKKDFPKIPYPDSAEIYKHFADVGKKLRGLHLFKDIPSNIKLAIFDGEGDSIIDKILYQDGNVYINKTQSFNNIPDSVWEFEIGDDKPANRWLKERKGRKLSAEDVLYYQQLIYVLSKTSEYMNQIDIFTE